MTTLTLSLKLDEVRQMRNGADVACEYAVRFYPGGEVRFTLPPGGEYTLVGDGRPIDVTIAKVK
ncbi:MAG: hypothetical protein RBS35_05660 [Azonexus sp.]|jgi:hypothetical protein|nr:hypothetical protein [Azonexus sp.]